MSRYPITDALSVDRLEETESALRSLLGTLPRGWALTDRQRRRLLPLRARNFAMLREAVAVTKTHRDLIPKAFDDRGFAMAVARVLALKNCLDALQSATNQIRDTLRQAVLEPLRAGADIRTFVQSSGRGRRDLKPVIARLRTRPLWRKRKRSRKAVPGGVPARNSSAPPEK